MSDAEALKVISNLYHSPIEDSNKGEELVIALGRAMYALEKQVPKRVTHEATLIKSCTCPSCGNVIDKFEKLGDSKVRVQYEHCHFCGQKLDWSDEK